MLIGEVSRRSGISARMLRHYDEIGLVSPTGRTAGGYREYAAADIQRLFEVESLRTLGLSLRELRSALHDPGFTPAALLADLISSTQARIAREQELLTRLQQVQATQADDWSAVLGIVALLRGLTSEDPSRRNQTALAVDPRADPPAEVLAEALLREGDANVAGALRWALRRASGDALSVLGPGLRAADPQVRLRAVAGIAQLEGDAASAVLAAALDSGDDAVRQRIALTLGARGDRRAIPHLLGMVIAGASDVEAAESLGAIAREHGMHEQLVGMLAAELDRETSGVELRLRLVQALAELPGPAARRVLERLSADPERRVAATAGFLLGR